ncbi:molecular chaperone DnaJ [Antrihabitans sp. YC3-6]|uniref:Molecular chaperone DnaJ n=1 Tax=Antrihabitans stalagmiti TaxID=2799499 RepID=A0A934NX03_9NOCA|nr:molecular chaperone DnaJ [Antrihabitans stalagmiti]MBJ8342807.1 molecular chaperone DnaJ [Antrihabitans stalagmiti]
MSDYPANVTLRPIAAWRGVETKNRVASNFSAPWRATLKLLDKELFNLGTGRRNAPAVLQIAMREQDFRIDGLPRANARPTHPGVILSIDSKHGPLTYPCDKFTTWQDNLRAIALALEALRKVDRYGITASGEQYTGWRAIESGAAPLFRSADDAERYLRSLTKYSEQGIGFVIQRARANTHPDRHDGERTEYDKVDAAVQLLEREGRL